MKVLYYFRHMSSSEALKYNFARKAAGLETLIQSSTPVYVTFAVENDIFKVHVGLHARNNNRIELEEASEDMYKSIDLVIDSLKRQLTREKGKQVEHHPHNNSYPESPSLTSPADEIIDEFETAPNILDDVPSSRMSMS